MFYLMEMPVFHESPAFIKHTLTTQKRGFGLPKACFMRAGRDGNVGVSWKSCLHKTYATQKCTFELPKVCFVKAGLDGDVDVSWKSCLYKTYFGYPPPPSPPLPPSDLTYADVYNSSDCVVPLICFMKHVPNLQKKNTLTTQLTEYN